MTPLTVLILAAGLGTRMKSRKAKVLHQAGGKTLLGHVAEAARALTPVENIFIVVGHQADEVRKTAPEGAGIIEQREQLGTGHAVLSGREVLEGRPGKLLILYGDCPLLRSTTLQHLVDMVELYSAAGVLMSARMEDPTGYGRVLRNSQGHVTSVVEQKAANPAQLAIREANMGIYCYRSELFWKYIGQIGTDNPAKEYYLTDMVEILYRFGHFVHAMTIDDPREALGINTRVELADADRLIRNRKVHQLMLDGVTIENPETVSVDADVRIGMDTVVEPFARLLGRTTIGEDCRIGAGAVLQDTELGNGVEIFPHTVITQSRIDNGAQVGPFARLRPRAHVCENAHVGNFVELKNTRLGEGSKASHLAYLGDAQIGGRTNIGAGTIICNYDGYAKHPTSIGAETFVGSNSTLVAPLEIADGAFIAAGSVITESVPSDALALGRAKQVNKEGWAANRRALKAAKKQQ
jgi:bifunctional UDP-N-acetylglucosamine pyrophosphorylase/glucosamine-1-phosphate N-acetyltransferase